jgi:hypothetical protein
MFLFLIFPRCFQICSIMGGCQIQYGKAVCADTRRDSANRHASVESHSTSPTTSGLCPFVVELYPTAIPLTMRNLEERHASGGCTICADALERRAAADRLRAERQLDAQRTPVPTPVDHMPMSAAAASSLDFASGMPMSAAACEALDAARVMCCALTTLKRMTADDDVQSESERLSLERVARSQAAAAALCRLLLPAHQSELAASNPNHNPANNA